MSEMTADEFVDLLRTMGVYRDSWDKDIRDENGKVKIAIVFGPRGAAFPFNPIPTPEIAFESITSIFDHPEELTWTENVGAYAIFKKKDIPYLKQRAKVVEEVLQRHGLTPEDARNMSIQQALAIREEIQSEMKVFAQQYLD